MNPKDQTKSNLDFNNINSNYILQKIFDFLKKNKFLKIAKINKVIQKRLNISINNYKEYSELYTPIEIELTPAKDIYDKFINIPEDKKEYYHIYFDDSKEEIKRNNLEQNEKVEKIKIIIDYKIKSFEGLFSNCKCISTINFKKFYRINVNNMSCMFSDCSELTDINLSNIITINTTTDINVCRLCEIKKIKSFQLRY